MFFHPTFCILGEIYNLHNKGTLKRIFFLLFSNCKEYKINKNMEKFAEFLKPFSPLSYKY